MLKKASIRDIINVAKIEFLKTGGLEGVKCNVARWLNIIPKITPYVVFHNLLKAKMSFYKRKSAKSGNQTLNQGFGSNLKKNIFC